ncbi:hypothetical protein [Nocardioides daphniae]|uniref:Uncharacterized protein n=1 Tax=Nocardioides daphniae TaxID=402297 RepID=A0A4P7UBL1_9ACTN|nr:hypothetical protein [Nocardioides daphniae]QCC77500.1 hypothetical protein E2C04_10510 [Nocardioides daphniae]GGD31390.1 hypothetical protein GCM10007231_33690 [Nocardioides daphniae]
MRVTLPSSHPISHIKLIAIDYDSGHCSIVAVDGRILTEQIPVPSKRGLVSRCTFIPVDSLLEIVAGGETITMNIGTVLETISVPVIYLDQNHWIDFARWRKNPEALEATKRPFFDLLAQAATAERVIIPLSSAHLSESSKRGGPSRLELAATMLQYSRGWQLRSVLGLRRAELRALFGGTPLVKQDAITLAPEAILDKMPDRTIGQKLGPEVAGLIRRQVWATVLVSLLLDPEAREDAGSELATRWAMSFAPLANHMRTNPKAKAWSRDLTRTRFFSDLGTDLPAAANESGMSPERFGEWLLHDAEAAISTTPGLGRLREVLHLRLSNADDKWEPNDLNDWLHLSYAAGYSDLVLGEKKTINYLRRSAHRVPPGALLHRRASEAIGDLAALLDGAPAEKPVA